MVDLEKRRSIRVYDPSVKISRGEMNEILKKATRAPSSMNMQPWRFVVVESEKGKKKLEKALSNNRTQLETSSAMILINTDLKKYDYAEKIYDMAYEGNVMPEGCSGQTNAKHFKWFRLSLRKRIEKATVLIVDSSRAAPCTLPENTDTIRARSGGFDHDRIIESSRSR